MKKLLSFLLCVAMLLSLVPMAAFAGDEETPVLATSITLDKTELLLLKDSSITLQVTAEPTGATDTFSWESSDEEVATVADGVVTAVGTGMTTITVTGKTENVEAKCKVIVYEEGNCAIVGKEGYNELSGAIDKAAEGDEKIILLIKDCEVVDFNNYEIKIDLNDFYLRGVSENSQNVTVVNTGSEGGRTLAATGTYANNVRDIVADGFDVKEVEGGKYEVFANTDADLYTVKVVTSTEDDRDMTNDPRDSLGDNQYGPLTTYEGKNVDVFAGDTVHVEVRVYGPRFVAAKVLLKYNKDNFDDATEEWSEGWEPDAKTGGYIFYKAKSGGGYWEPTVTDALDADTDEAGKKYYVLGSFDFEVKTVDEGKFTSGEPSLKEMFEVTNQKSYIAGAWKEGWESNPANEVTNRRDDFANIRLIPMKASIKPESGLVYSNTKQNLLSNECTVTDSNTGETVTGYTVEYAVLTKAEADNGTEPVYVSTLPQGLDAGDYVAYYRVAKPGYITVEKSEVVTINPYPVLIKWEAEGYNPGTQQPEGHTLPGACNYWVAYAEDTTFDSPYATFTGPGGKVIKLTTGGATTADGAAVEYDGKVEKTSGNETLNKVGTYTFKATLDSNFKIDESTENATIIIDGGIIEGYTLKEPGEASTGTLYLDGKGHLAAQLGVDEGATLEVTKTYSISRDGGKTWIEPEKYEENGIKIDEETGIPEVSKVGKYKVKVVLSKDSYYDQEITSDFEVKTVEYYVEVSDFVSGWDFVQVYTNESLVPGFTYDGHYMYDISRLEYKYQSKFDSQGNKLDDGTKYTKVYGVLVYGIGDENLVMPSNDTNTIKTIDPEVGKSTLNRNDVNQSNSCDINDLVAVQGVYNVNTVEFLNDAKMHIAIKCDVTGNKTVDMADYAQVKKESR